MGQAVINGVELGEEQAKGLEAERGLRVPSGRFWYDPDSGAWGAEGGPTRGFTLPGLQLGGPLSEEASGGDTDVLVNGRRLPEEDIAGLRQLVPVMPGRYWMDAKGEIGFEDGPALINLFDILETRGPGGGQRWVRAHESGYAGEDEGRYLFAPS